MARLIISNIGPLKDVDIDLKKVNVFMGPQGCGKSTLAKIISFCSWMEKGSNETESVAAKGIISSLISYHRMEGYFREESRLAYLGDDVNIFYQYPEPLPYFGEVDDYHVSAHKKGEIVFHRVQKGTNPKVAYIPAERNFVSVVPHLGNYAEKDDSLQSFVNDWFEAKRKYTVQHPLHIGILDIDYFYNTQVDTDVVIVNGQKILLDQSSSGFQSIIPLMALISYLSSTIYEENKPFSPSEQQQMRDILSHVSSDSLGEMEKQLIERIRGFLQSKVYTHTQFIVEEPEQNLFPSTQCELLYFMLEAINHGKNHRLVLTTHSPYILYALNNCILANIVRDEMPEEERKQLLFADVRLSPGDVGVWEIENGCLRTYGDVTTNKTIQDNDGLIRKNYFNSLMGLVMKDFNNLLMYKD